MTDPTIPDLVARLRELHEKLQALQVGTPEFTAARQLFRDVLQLSAPGILDALDHLESITTWRPIEECGELERGRYLVQLRSGAQIVALWSGDSEGWVLRQRDLDEFDSPRDITHVHRMGPIRGPEETT